MKRLFLLFILSGLIAGSCTYKNGFTVDGSLKDHNGEFIKIKRVDVNILVPVDSVQISKKGTFRLKVKCSQPDFYEVGLNNSDFITLLALPGDKISLGFGGKFMADNYTVKGSPETLKLKMLDSTLAVTKEKIAVLTKKYNEASTLPDAKTKQDEINAEFNRVLKEQRMYNIGFILKNLRSFASVKALYQMIDQNTYVLYDTRDAQYLKLVSDTLNHLYPQSKQAKTLKINFEKEYNQLQMDRVTEFMSSTQTTKLDPDLKDVNGNRIALSSLKGKYVLLTFWSAASRDCLADNLVLKDIYRTYHPKGFEIYQVNVDSNQEIWKKAIKFDELPWISVREDDPANPKNAILYNARIVPANFLYDRQGNIIATRLYGRTLQLKLSQLFAN